MSSRAARKAVMREARAIATQSPAELLRGDAAPTTPAWDVTAWTGALGNGHQGADSSRMRGFVYFPELDTRKEITSYSRTEILRRSRFLYANTGVARRMINGLSRMIAGTGLVYQAATSDTQWNKLAEAYVENVIRSRHAYDLGGRYNGYNSQRASLIFRFRDGDCAQVLSRDEQTGAPRFAFYEGHQIGTSSIYTSPASTEGWRDGVYLGRHNQPLGYRILGDGDYADLDSGSVLFQCDYERGGQPRGVSALSHAINHLLDATEIKSYIKAGVKLTNLNAYWIETAAGASAGGSTLGSAAGAAGPKVKVDTPSGPINLQKILGGGEIPALGAGQSIKFNTSASPHPNQMGLLEHLIREASWGLPWGGMAPELLWNITGLGGANTRFVMADAQGFIESGQQALVDDKCQPEVEFILAAGLQSGALRRCQDPEWWKARWILPPRITVDFGRDGKLYLDQISRGALTFSRFHGWNGADAYPEIDRWLDEMKYWKDGAVSRGLDPTLVLGSVYGRSGITSPNADPALPTGDQADTGGENANDTEAMLTEIKKNPAKARAFLDQLARHD